MKDITPPAVRCSMMASCPSVHEITPEYLRCALGSCPSVHEITPEYLRCALGNCPSVHEVTPVEARCSITMSCPGLHDITPEAAACAIATSCPALFSTDGYQDGGIAVIGKVSPEIAEMLRHKTGPDEFVVVIPRKLYEAIRNQGPIGDTNDR